MAIYYYNRCIDQDDADTNEKMESGEQKFYNATAHGRAYVLNAVCAKRRTVFQMFHVKQEFFTEGSCTVAIFPCMC